MERQRLGILLVDDDEEEYLITRDLFAEIEVIRCELEWVATYDAGLHAIVRQEHDVFLLDYRLGLHDGIELLRAAVEQGCTAPIIMLTGQSDRDVDIAALRAGASDYLVKGQLDARLLERSIRYAIERKRAEEERERLISQLQEALANIKTLRGLLPICSSCKKIRDDTGYWNQIETYIHIHTEADFSHGLCPDCIARLYPELNAEMFNKGND
jgi:FixJ family two-component response regulator